ncbi:MAG: hypothetical protein LUD46_09810 [Parabacteroides sp.]|nr:hypothetical protein [Parabacteroides sp.]
MEKGTKQRNSSLRFVLAFDVIDEAGNSVMDSDRQNAVFVDMSEGFPVLDQHWGIPMLLGIYAKHFTSLPEFSTHFPWYHPILKDAGEPNSNSVHKFPDTPFVYLIGSTLFAHPSTQNQISVEDNIPTGFPL